MSVKTLNPLDLATRITGDLFQWKDNQGEIQWAEAWVKGEMAAKAWDQNVLTLMKRQRYVGKNDFKRQDRN